MIRQGMTAGSSRRRLAGIAIAMTAALATACSNEQSSSAAQAKAGAAAAAPALPTGAEGVRRYAECASTLDAVANLYSAIASQSSGADSEQMLRIAAHRSNAARVFEARAVDLSADQPNVAPNHVGQLMSARRDRLEQERARQPFEDFAVWLGGEGDQCAAIAPPGL